MKDPNKISKLFARIRYTPDYAQLLDMDTDNETKRHVNRYGLRPVTPAERLPFPDRAKLTAVEILTFFPNSIHSHKFVYRFVSNGATRNVLWTMINTARDLPDELKLNCVGSYMYKTMGNAGYTDWTVKTHKLWHDDETWDRANLEVTGIGIPFDRIKLKLVAATVPFRELSRGVRSVPQGFDALDLTRMVQYCESHPQEPWMYPQDFSRLLERLEGPAILRPEHCDGAAFQRWQDARPPPGRTWSRQELQIATEALDAQPRTKKRGQRSSMVDGNVSTRSMVGCTTQADDSQRLSRGSSSRQEFEATDAAHMEGRPRLVSRYSPSHMEQRAAYSRTAAEWTVPPVIVEAPSTKDVRAAFVAEHMFGEKNEYSAYAFGGPRRTAPYRMLHQIEMPHHGDSSGWAENLRWAIEQRACFGHSADATGWNESPVHMEYIAKLRKERVWASDELLDLINHADRH